MGSSNRPYQSTLQDIEEGRNRTRQSTCASQEKRNPDMLKPEGDCCLDHFVFSRKHHNMYNLVHVIASIDIRSKKALQLAEGSKVRICRVLPPLWLVGDTVRKDGGRLQVFPPLTPNPWNGAVVTRRTSKVHVHMLVKALGDLRISHVWVQNACKPFQTGFGLARQRPKEHFLFGWAVHGACASHGLLHSLHRENPSSNGTTRRSHNVGNPRESGKWVCTGVLYITMWCCAT